MNTDISQSADDISQLLRAKSAKSWDMSQTLGISQTTIGRSRTNHAGHVANKCKCPLVRKVTSFSGTKLGICHKS
jgi:hypothetical protein